MRSKIAISEHIRSTRFVWMTVCAWLRPSAVGKMSMKTTPSPLIVPLMLNREHTPVTDVHAGAKKFEMPDSWSSRTSLSDEARPLALPAAPARERRRDEHQVQTPFPHRGSFRRQRGRCNASDRTVSTEQSTEPS